MAMVDRFKVEIGWFKAIFGVLVAIAASLGWLAQNYGSASPLLVIAGEAVSFAMTIALTFAIGRANRLAYRRIKELANV